MTMLRVLFVAFVLLAPIPALALDVKTVDAPSGMAVWLSEEHSLPIISVAISIPAGSAYDPADKPGLASFTASLLDEGAGGMDANAFKEALDAKAIRFSASAGRDWISIRMTTLTENADEAFRLLALALNKPRFDTQAVERVRVQFLSLLKQDDEDPGTIASRAWTAAYFGTHPYAHPSNGNPDSIAAITEADIKAYAAAHISRGGAKMAVAGDIGAARLKRYLQAVFGAMPAQMPTDLPVPIPQAMGTRTIPMNIPQPNAAFGRPGLLRSAPDFIPAYVANYIFGGGGFSSRLMDEVRDKRGLTYGISTGLQALRAAGVISGNVASAKAKILQALDVTKSEMARFAEGGATQKELDDAKTYLTGSFPLNLDSNGKIAGALVGFMQDGLQPDYIAKRNDLVNAVTLDQVNAAAKKYYDPASLFIVIAGTPAAPAPAPVKDTSATSGPRPPEKAPEASPPPAEAVPAAEKH